MTAHDSLADVVVVDTELFGTPGLHSAFLVDGEEPVLVDAGAAPAAGPVESALESQGVGREDLAGIVATHVHLDHAGAVGALARRYPNATVYVHERGRQYLTDPDRLARLVESAREAMGDAVVDAYGSPEPVQDERTVELVDGDVVPCGDRDLDVVHAPGHAPHQVALHDSRSGALFAADAAGMFLGGDLLPTTPAPDFDLETSLATVERLRDLAPDALCYGHFGVRGDADVALAEYAELLPAWVDAVEAALADPELDGRNEVVTALREDWPSPTLERDVQGVVHANENGR